MPAILGGKMLEIQKLLSYFNFNPILYRKQGSKIIPQPYEFRTILLYSLNSWYGNFKLKLGRKSFEPVVYKTKLFTSIFFKGCR